MSAEKYSGQILAQKLGYTYTCSGNYHRTFYAKASIELIIRQYSDGKLYAVLFTLMDGTRFSIGPFSFPSSHFHEYEQVLCRLV